MSINEKIKKLRQDSKITQEVMANYLNVSQTYISKLESNERNLTIDILNKICNLFLCDFNDLIDDNKSIKPIALPFRKSDISAADLENFSDANKIIMNFNEMIDLLEENDDK